MEIEARVKVENLELLRSKLKELGAQFGRKEKQSDVIFKPKGQEQVVQKAGSYILRIRKTDSKTIFTFKALTEVAGSWVEHELEISSAEEMEKIILALGFVNSLEVHKEREHAQLGELNLCLDRVKELGDYLEVEIISEDVKLGKQKMIQFLNELGYSENEIIHNGYVALLFKQKGVKFENTG